MPQNPSSLSSKRPRCSANRVPGWSGGQVVRSPLQAGQSWSRRAGRSRPRERSTSSSRSSPRPRHQTGKRSVRSSLAENVTNSAQQEEMCKIHQMGNLLNTTVSVSTDRVAISSSCGDSSGLKYAQRQGENTNRKCKSFGSITIFSLIMPDENA